MARRSYDRRSLPFLRNPPLVERHWRNGGGQDLGEAPCPRCGKPMVARVGRRGPYFHCACKKKEDPR
jgi:hypothetical protein